jgi:hypothetical protein
MSVYVIAGFRTDIGKSRTTRRCLIRSGSKQCAWSSRRFANNSDAPALAHIRSVGGPPLPIAL